MAAPVTLGKLCSNTSDMEIGDYIKCVYEAPTANVPGYFSQLGTIDPTRHVVATTITDGGEPVVTDEEEAYTELPTTPGTTASGFFYLLKADYGLLMADRMIQQQISWASLNTFNYIYGRAFNCSGTKTEVIRNVTITHQTVAPSDTTANSTKTDTTVDNYTKADRTVTKVTTAVVVTSNVGADGSTVESKTITTTVTEETIKYAHDANEVIPDDSTTETDPASIINKANVPNNVWY